MIYEMSTSEQGRVFKLGEGYSAEMSSEHENTLAISGEGDSIPPFIYCGCKIGCEGYGCNWFYNNGFHCMGGCAREPSTCGWCDFQWGIPPMGET